MRAVAFMFAVCVLGCDERKDETKAGPAKPETSARRVPEEPKFEPKKPETKLPPFVDRPQDPEPPTKPLGPEPAKVKPAVTGFSSDDPVAAAGYTFEKIPAAVPGNALSEEEAKEKYLAKLKSVRGKKVRWPVLIDRVHKNGKVTVRVSDNGVRLFPVAQFAAARVTKAGADTPEKAVASLPGWVQGSEKEPALEPLPLRYNAQFALTGVPAAKLKTIAPGTKAILTGTVLLALPQGDRGSRYGTAEEGGDVGSFGGLFLLHSPELRLAK